MQTRFFKLLFFFGFIALSNLVYLIPAYSKVGKGGYSSGFDNLLKSVVRIDVREASYLTGSKTEIRGVGSGVIMTRNGHILTNAHVVSPQAEDIQITLSNLERVTARIVGWDHWTDLAVLIMDAKDIKKRKLSFSYAKFGNSKKLKPTDTVYAVGTPNGLARTITKGIISNADRYFEAQDSISGHETGYFNNWLQTDAAINPGNSGGPLVDKSGKVIGINTRAYLGANNLAFAVPSIIAQQIMSDLLGNGRIVRSYIGIVPGPLQDLENFYNLEANNGMLINSVDPGSPAAKKKLKPGDIILSIDEEKVDGRFPEQLPPIKRKISNYPIGAKINLEIKRNDKIINVFVKTEKLESRAGKRFAFEDWGLSVEKVSKAMARERKLESKDGVFVIGANQAFPAAEAGLFRGDIITSANHKLIKSLDDLKKVYKIYQENPEKVLLEVLRSNQTSYFVLKP